MAGVPSTNPEVRAPDVQDAPVVMESGAVVVPPVEPKSGPNVLLWIAIVLGIAIAGGSAYFFYLGQQKPAETVSGTPPALTNLSTKPNQGFNSSIPAATATPATTPTISSSDSITDIEKDLNTTSLESGNSTEFTTDLQSL